MHPTYPIDFYKITSTWTPLTSPDYTNILLTLYALDGSEEFDFVETHVLCKNAIYIPLIRSISTKLPQRGHLNLSRLQRYGTYRVCTRWLG